MSVIYKPKGAALEYSPLAANLWLTCTHGCKYCYAPACLHKTKEDFFIEAPARKKVIYELAKDCQKMKGDKRPILLCFCCDPYQPHDAKRAITREALEVLALYHMTAQVLTKGGMRAKRDFDLLKKYNWKFGSTICMEDETGWEPYAASNMDRITAVNEAHSMGIFTWVSVEPVIYPEATLELIGHNLKIVDFWKIGKLNHDKEVEMKINWKKFLHDVQLLLKGRPHYIKTDLMAFG